jgi:hypothetical protein
MSVTWVRYATIVLVLLPIEFSIGALSSAAGRCYGEIRARGDGWRGFDLVA